MRIFIYEFTTGGGLLDREPAAALADLLAEGRAMVAALTADFAAIGGTETTVLADRRLTVQTASGRAIAVGDREEARAAFDRLAAGSDWTVVIAPETEELLLGYCRRVVEVGGRLLGPPPELVALASDKQATAEHLAAAGLSVPHGAAWAMGPPWPDDFPYPAIWKPRDGAGSQGLCYLADRAANPSGGATKVGSCEGRLERYCPGMAASVAVLCGPNGITPLAPCRQVLSDDGRFRYLGGSLPLEPALAERATRLALRAVAALPQPKGYVGVDLVLGSQAHRGADFLLEVNPRLTTSYVGLRAACETNLAKAMLAIAQGKMATIHFQQRPVRFTADGRVERP